MKRITLTHKGWFGFCPVYFAGLDTESPLVDPRHWIFAPLMWASEFAYGAAFLVLSIIRPDFEPSWPLTVTGELQPSIVKDFGA